MTQLLKTQTVLHLRIINVDTSSILFSAIFSLKGRSPASRPIAHSISKNPAQNKSSMEKR